MSVQLTTFTNLCGNSKAENQNLSLSFSLTDRNIAIVVAKRVLQEQSIVSFGLVYPR